MLPRQKLIIHHKRYQASLTNDGIVFLRQQFLPSHRMMESTQQAGRKETRRQESKLYVFVCNLLYLLNELLCAEKQITEREHFLICCQIKFPFIAGWFAGGKKVRSLNKSLRVEINFSMEKLLLNDRIDF
jgi:hypothetical protein